MTYFDPPHAKALRWEASGALASRKLSRERRKVDWSTDPFNERPTQPNGVKQFNDRCSAASARLQSDLTW